MKNIIYAVSITWCIMLSARVVWIPTPLNPVEQISLIGILLDYTIRRSKDQEKTDE